MELTTKAKVGALVNCWPKSIVDLAPRIGTIVESYDSGVVRIFLIPMDDGAVSVLPNAYHKSDSRLRDSVGNPTTMAKNNGCWEYHPDWLKVQEGAIPQEGCCPETCMTEARVAEIATAIAEAVCKKVCQTRSASK